MDINYQHIARLRSFDVKGPSQVVDFGQVNVADVICRVIVADLTACPIYAFNLDGFTRFDRAVGRVLGMPAVLHVLSLMIKFGYCEYLTYVQAFLF